MGASPHGSSRSTKRRTRGYGLKKLDVACSGFLARRNERDRVRIQRTLHVASGCGQLSREESRTPTGCHAKSAGMIVARQQSPEISSGPPSCPPPTSTGSGEQRHVAGPLACRPSESLVPALGMIPHDEETGRRRGGDGHVGGRCDSAAGFLVTEVVRCARMSFAGRVAGTPRPETVVGWR